MTQTPTRHQRKRTKGAKLPAGCKCVDRTTKWGNPFRLVHGDVYINASHRRKVFDPWVWFCVGNEETVTRLFRSVVTGHLHPGKYGFCVSLIPDLMFWRDHFKSLDVSELKGLDLACFCSLDQPCHADVLIELANAD